MLAVGVHADGYQGALGLRTSSARDPDRWLWSFTILTTQATDALGHLHDRAPVIVAPDMREDWLGPAPE